MLNIIASSAKDLNPEFVQTVRHRNEDNVKWVNRNLEDLASREGASGLSYLVLIGGKQKAYFHTRVAQGHLRNDMSPSHWSHVVLLQGSGPTKKGAIWEIPLEPAEGFGYPPSDNAVEEAHLSNYASKNMYPNIALMQLPVKLSEMKKTILQFKKQRVDLDCVELLLLWLGYAWGVGRATNPLFDGYGIPSAAFIEALCSANGYDLTPGLESRASCPEAIWQAARWWHEFQENQQDVTPIKGMWHTEHYLGK
ncbi:hypothetical protein FMN63_09680 [Stappia sp. BW2]|uniref:hypothetical protein n=1 Tax=Stappia sp. BW2 TaxID=2592622 RepID=UPI0011DEED91|nr:hypothetical protein [Stappia sp. BW2]TYC68904.1 hypothetical protein FMN63_09680 [Stappia sp. BW2]